MTIKGNYSEDICGEGKGALVVVKGGTRKVITYSTGGEGEED